MDSLTLQALLRELQPRLLNTVIQKVRVRDGGTLYLQLRDKQTQYLQIVLHTNHPGFFVTEAPPSPSDAVVGDTVAALRKYLLGARIRTFRKELSDRAVHVTLENYRLSTKREEFLLVLELVPNRARALLLNADNEVIAALPRQNVQVASRYRAQSTSKERIDSLDRERFEWLVSRFGIQEVWRHIFGFGPLWVEEVLYRSAANNENIWTEMQSLLDRVRQGPYSPTLYRPESVDQESRLQLDRSTEWTAGRRSSPKAPIVLPFPFDSLRWADSQSYGTMNEAIIHWQALVREMDARSDNAELQRISKTLKKKRRLQENLARDLQKNLSASNFKVYADLLYAHAQRHAKGLTSVNLTNLFEPALPEITIPLDPQHSQIENANRYAKLYRKSNRSIPLIRNRMEALRAEIDSLLTAQQRLLSGISEHDPKRSVAERAPKLMPHSKNSQIPENVERGESAQIQVVSAASLKRVAREFVSSEGLQILVGRSSKDNDTLTQKVARSEDFWLHVAGYGGSHVVLRNPAKLTVAPKKSLLEAAQLAAFFSQARNAPKVEVHYTQKRFVSKPRGAKPGLVHLKEYKAILARPQLLPIKGEKNHESLASGLEQG